MKVSRVRWANREQADDSPGGRADNRWRRRQTFRHAAIKNRPFDSIIASMSNEVLLAAIVVGYALTGLVWWSLNRKLDRKADNATMMAQIQYLIREIHQIEAGEPKPVGGVNSWIPT